MSHKNYSKFSSNNITNFSNKLVENNNEPVDNLTVTEIEEPIEIENPVQEVIETTAGLSQIEEVAIEEITGFVDNCEKLFVRKEASKDSEQICIIDKLTNLVIDITNSTEDFYKVKTSEGVEGYCMKKFITINK